MGIATSTAAALYLRVSGEISVDVTANVDGVIFARLLLHSPHLLLAKRRTCRVDLEAKRLRRQVFAGVVHQTHLEGVKSNHSNQIYYYQTTRSIAQ